MNHKPTPTLEKVVPEAEDFLPLLGTDHIELYCGNAKQSAYYYMTAWGLQTRRVFRPLETGNKTSVSYVLRQDKITLVLTSPLQSGGLITPHQPARRRRESSGAVGERRCEELRRNHLARCRECF